MLTEKASKFMVIEEYVTHFDDLVTFNENISQFLQDGWELFGETRMVSNVRNIDKRRFTVYSQTLIKR